MRQPGVLDFESFSLLSRDCPICQESNPAPIYINKMAPIGGFDMSYQIGRCNKCGFHFAHVLADEPTFKKYYQSVSKYDVAGYISKIDQLRIDAAVRICQGKIPYSAMVVDLGCGYGALLSCLQSAGWINLHGIDPAPNSAARANELFGLKNIYCSTMAEAHKAVPLDKADLVCIMAVLEHLPNLRADLADLLKKLRPGCRVLVEVPALGCFSGANSEPFGEFSLEHIQFFSALSLTNFFGSLGAKTLAIETVDLQLVTSGGLFGLFELTSDAPTSFEPIPENPEEMATYIEQSKSKLDAALERVPNAPLIIYGAGSHTARLLPRLAGMAGKRVVAVVDNNPNLLGKRISEWVIQSPSVIETLPDTHILISSFRSQEEIASTLRGRYPNPLVLLYQ